MISSSWCSSRPSVQVYSTVSSESESQAGRSSLSLRPGLPQWPMSGYHGVQTCNGPGVRHVVRVGCPAAGSAAAPDFKLEAPSLRTLGDIHPTLA